MNNILFVGAIVLSLIALHECRLGTRCLDDTACDAGTECCVVSSYIIRRGKCAPKLRENARCKVGATYMSSFWNLPYACGCGHGTTCVEEAWQDSAFPGVNLKRDRCRVSMSGGSTRAPPTNPKTTLHPRTLTATTSTDQARPTKPSPTRMF